MSRLSRYLTLIQILSLLILLCMSISPQFYSITKLFLSIFISSRSSFKYYLFFVFMLVACFIWNTKRWRRNIWSRTDLVLPLSTILLFLLAIAEFIYLSLKFDFSIFELRGFYGNGDLSNSNLFHLHTGKVVVGALARFFAGGDFRYTYDSGISFLKFFPVWLIQFHCSLAIVFLLSFVRSFLILPLPPRGYVLLYLLSAYTVLKNVFDGGIFFHETAFALPLFLSVAALPANVLRKKQRTILFLTWLTTSVSVGVACLFGMTLELLLSLYLPLLLLTIVVYAVERCVDYKRHLLGVSFASFFLLSFYLIATQTDIMSSFGVSSFRYARTQIKSDQEIYLLQHTPIRSSQGDTVKVLEERKYHGMYFYVLRALQNLKLVELSKLGSNINYYETSLPGVDCDSNQLFRRKYWLQAVPDQVLKNGAFEGGLSWSVKDGRDGSFILDVQHRGCLPLPIEWMLLILQELEVDKAVIRYEQSF